MLAAPAQTQPTFQSNGRDCGCKAPGPAGLGSQQDGQAAYPGRGGAPPARLHLSSQLWLGLPQSRLLLPAAQVRTSGGGSRGLCRAPCRGPSRPARFLAGRRPCTLGWALERASSGAGAAKRAGSRGGAAGCAGSLASAACRRPAPRAARHASPPLRPAVHFRQTHIHGCCHMWLQPAAGRCPGGAAAGGRRAGGGTRPAGVRRQACCSAQRMGLCWGGRPAPFPLPRAAKPGSRSSRRIASITLPTTHRHPTIPLLPAAHRRRSCWRRHRLWVRPLARPPPPPPPPPPPLPPPPTAPK